MKIAVVLFRRRISRADQSFKDGIASKLSKIRVKLRPVSIFRSRFDHSLQLLQSFFFVAQNGENACLVVAVGLRKVLYGLLPVAFGFAEQSHCLANTEKTSGR